MKPHETLAAQFLDRVAVSARAQVQVTTGDEQLAWRHVAEIATAAARVIVYGGKSVDQLVRDVMRPKLALAEDDTKSERPVAKKREQEEP